MLLILILTLILVLIIIELIFKGEKKENFNISCEIAAAKAKEAVNAIIAEKEASSIAGSSAALAKAAAAASLAIAAVSKVAERKASSEKEPDAPLVASDTVAKAASTAAAAAAAISKVATNKATVDKANAEKKTAETLATQAKTKEFEYKLENDIITYNMESKGMWASEKSKEYTCDDANCRGRNIIGNNGDYNNYCIFNTETDAKAYCNFDPTCKGYINNNNIFYQLTRNPYKNPDTPNSMYFNKKVTNKVTILINDILAMNPHGWYDANSYNSSTNKWVNKVDNSSFDTKNFQKTDSNIQIPHIFGGSNATILSKIPWPGENKDYTFIHLAKYNGNTKGRIWTGTTGNWLSGFWNNSVGFFHERWFNPDGKGINVSNGGQDWLFSIDMKDFVRVNKGAYEKKNDPAYSPDSITINGGPYFEPSDFAIAEFMIFKRSLKEEEYTKIEDYFYKKYGLFGTVIDPSIVSITDKVIADKIIADKVAADKAAADKIIADKVAADKVVADKIIADKAAADKIIADKVAADKAAADKAAADKAAADKAAADKAAANKAAADKAAADKAAANKAAADKEALCNKNPQALLGNKSCNHWSWRDERDRQRWEMPNYSKTGTVPPSWDCWYAPTTQCVSRDCLDSPNPAQACGKRNTH
jgi:hypothetical protein